MNIFLGEDPPPFVMNINKPDQSSKFSYAPVYIYILYSQKFSTVTNSLLHTYLLFSYRIANNPGLYNSYLDKMVTMIAWKNAITCTVIDFAFVLRYKCKKAANLLCHTIWRVIFKGCIFCKFHEMKHFRKDCTCEVVTLGMWVLNFMKKSNRSNFEIHEIYTPRKHHTIIIIMVVQCCTLWY